MKRNPLAVAVGACLGAMVLGLATPAWPAGRASMDTDGMVTLNFTDADLDTVIRAVGEATQRNILVDPRVKGTINLVTEKPVPRAQALAALGTALRMQGYALVESSGFWRVVPEADAKSQGGPVGSNGAPVGAGGDSVITQVFKLNYESANNLLPVLRPLITANNAITAYPANNTLVITDYAENVKRLAHIIRSVDAPIVGDYELIPLQYALAVDLAPIVMRILDTGPGASADASVRSTVIAESRTNSLILRAATPARVTQIKSLVAKLDQPTARPGNIWVVPLRNAEATKLAQTLRGIVSGDTSPASLNAQSTPSLSGGGSLLGQGGAGAPGTGAPGGALTTPGGTTGVGGMPSTAAFPAVSTAATVSTAGANGPGGAAAGMIQADPSTNSIIITASERVYRNLREVIDRLDARRPQIYVESLIVEVSSEKAEEFGVQLQGLLGGGKNRVFGGSNFTDPTSGSNIFTLGTQTNTLLNAGNTAAAIPAVIPAAGTNIALLHNFGGVFGMAALVRAMSNQSGVNVLSTPNLLTLDNEEARIVIAQSIPTLSGQYAQTGSTATVSPFQTFDRKTVGLTLKIRPQISEGGLVRLQIYQENSTVDTTNAASIAGNPVFNTRSIESNVLVEDGQLIALGGLLSDGYNDSAEKVPLLGDIPILGALFRYETKKRSKTNLMIFLRPYIIRDTSQSDALSSERYGRMEGLRQGYEPATRILGKDELPALPPINNPQAPLIAPPRAVPAPIATPLPGAPATPLATPTAPSGTSSR